MKTQIQIDIVSDVVCPWCYVGKKNLEKAMAMSPQYDFQVQWFPFQLNPFVPDEGVNHHEYLVEKFGNLSTVQQAYDRLNKIGREVGINFVFDKIEKGINTFHLHRILMAVLESGKQTLVKSLFLEAFFEKALDLTQESVVKEILQKADFSATEIEKLLDKDFFAEETLAVIENISKQGISGVPLFIIDQKYGLSGAQPVEVFLQTFEKIVPTKQENLVCEVDNPNC